MEGAHPGSTGHGACAAFQLANQFFQRAAGGVVVTRVGGPFLLQPEDAVELLDGIVNVGRGGVNRRGRRREVAGLAAIAPVHGLAFDFHDRFQRTPSLVSSRMTPCVARFARISSERAKLRDFLAAVRSAMSASTSASESPPLRAEGFNTSKTESKRFKNSSAATTLPAGNWPASMAVLVSRMYSKTVPSASAVLRSSSSAASNADAAAHVRSANVALVPSGSLSVSRRSL